MSRSVHLGLDAAGRMHLGVLMGGNLPAVATHLLHDGRRHRVRAGLLGGAGVLEHLLGGHSRLHGNDTGHFRLPHSHRAGFVEDQRVGLGQQFQVIAALDEDSIPRRRADGRREGGRRGEPDAARVVDDQHAQRAAALARHQINDQSQEKIDRNKLGREPVGDGLDVRLAMRGLLDHVDDAGHGGLVAHLYRPNHQPAALDHGSGKHPLAPTLRKGMYSPVIDA